MLAHTAAGFLIDVGKVGWERSQTVCLQCSRCAAKSLTPTPLSMTKAVTDNHTSEASSDASRFRCQRRGNPAPAGRRHRGRLFCPTYLAKQKSGSAAGTNTRLVPTAAGSPGFTRQLLPVAKAPLPLQRAARNTQARHCAARLAGEAKECALPGGVAGCSARRPTYFSWRCQAK